MNSKLCQFAVAVAVTFFVGTLRAETQRGDITAAIRAAGYTITNTVFQPDVAAKTNSYLMNGKWKGERYLSENGMGGPITFDFSIDAAFLPGEDVVVTGLTFIVGGNDTGLWGSWSARMPAAWTLQGSNDGGASWTTISTVSGFSGYAQSYDATEMYTASGTVSFCNWKSFRKYRITVTEATGSTTYFLQISEIAVHGFYGGTVVQPEPALIDITAGARAAGAQTYVSNAGEANAWLILSSMFDGVFGYNSNRYLSDQTTTKALFDKGDPVTIDYTISDTHAREADVVVTGYSIDVDQIFTGSKARLPKTWELQGWDGSAWVTIDSHAGFTDWQTVQVKNEADQVEHPHYAYTFSFTNSVSYRKYRLSVSEVVDRVSGSNYFQLTEFQLWGYVDADLAGRVGTTTEGMDLDITACGRASFVPTTSCSSYDNITEAVSAGNVTNLFDGNISAGFLARLGTDGNETVYIPFHINYTIPDTYLPNKEIVLKSYTFTSKTNSLAQYVNRAPKSWTVEGYAEGRWRTIDVQKDFTGWQTGDNHRYYATFPIPENKLACHAYRIVIQSVTGTSSYGGRDAMHQFLLYEIALGGKWGVGIAEPPPPEPGTLIRIQ